MTQNLLSVATFCLCTGLMTPNPALATDGWPLRFGDVGIYGTVYDFCTFTVYKLSPSDDEKRLTRYREMIHRSHQQGKFNLVGLYSFDRVTYSKPIEVYIRQTDQLLDAIDLSEVDALFLSEENVTWNNGLAILNQLYDHVKSRFKGPVFQWYTMPDIPHPKQRADGWIVDVYGFRHTEFRRHLMKYLILGKPVILCINASEDVAPWESSQEQVLVCREFNIPIFFYAVDRELGAPNIWVGSDEPGLAEWRGWAFRVMEMARAVAPDTLPEPGAQFSPGRPVEIAGDREGETRYHEDFADLSFMDDAWITGFLQLRWSGERELLWLLPDATSPTEARLAYHFFSVLPMKQIRIDYEAELANGAQVGVELSMDGRTWKSGDATPENWQGRNLWVRFRLSSPPGKQPACVLKSWTLSGKVITPKERAIILKAVRGKVHYRDSFRAPRYWQLAELSAPDELIFRRGGVSIRGKDGHVNRIEIKQRFTCEQPLKALRIELESRAWERALNAHNEVGISLDGAEVLLKESSRGRGGESGRFDGVLSIDTTADQRFQSVREFWVHLVMVNASGVLTNPSNTIRRLEVWAETDSGTR